MMDLQVKYKLPVFIGCPQVQVQEPFYELLFFQAIGSLLALVIANIRRSILLKSLQVGDRGR